MVIAPYLDLVRSCVLQALWPRAHPSQALTLHSLRNVTPAERESLEIGSSAGAPSALSEAAVIFFFPPSHFSSLRVMILLVTSRSDLCRSTCAVCDFVCTKFILCSALSVVVILKVRSKKTVTCCSCSHPVVSFLPDASWIHCFIFRWPLYCRQKSSVS